MPVRVTHRRRANGTWVDGSGDGMTFQAQIYESGSRYGINRSPVSRLRIINSEGKVVYDYERGSSVRSKTKKATELKNYIVKNARKLAGYRRKK